MLRGDIAALELPEQLNHHGALTVPAMPMYSRQPDDGGGWQQQAGDSAAASGGFSSHGRNLNTGVVAVGGGAGDSGYSLPEPWEQTRTFERKVGAGEGTPVGLQQVSASSALCRLSRGGC